MVLAVLALAGCGGGSADQGSHTDPDQVDAVTAPERGACRELTPADLRNSSNASRTVDCSQTHTAVTIAVDDLPDRFADSDRDDTALEDFVQETCAAAFARYLGADESTAMRTMLGWAWFRPSEKAWADGARWYRCDLTGGTTASRSLLDLPEDAAELLAGVPDDRWMACAVGSRFDGAPRVPCSQKHDWRAVTTIKVGEADDAYPGDAAVQRRTKAYCQGSVAAWLRYPVTYELGYTWFHRSEWELGNRRSVCWAGTTH